MATTTHCEPKFCAASEMSCGVLDGGCVYTHLVRTRQKHGAKIVHGSNPATHGQRHEALLCSARDHINHGRAIVARGRYVEKDQLVRSLRVIKFCTLDRIARVAKVEEFCSLDNTSTGDVETGNNPLSQHDHHMSRWGHNNARLKLLRWIRTLLPCADSVRPEGEPPRDMKIARDRHSFPYVGVLLLLMAAIFGGCASPYRQGAGEFDTVVVDAGHGGFDRAGRSVSGSPEKVLTLDTAKRLAKVLRSKGFRVIETRTRDVFVPLGSAHGDLQQDGRQHLCEHPLQLGASPGGSRNRDLLFQPAIVATCLDHSAANLRAYPTENRGVKRNNFHVLRENRRPAVLCELGFFRIRRITDISKTARIASDSPSASLTALSLSGRRPAEWVGEISRPAS